jgi:hypothetical protein
MWKQFAMVFIDWATGFVSDIVALIDPNTILSNAMHGLLQFTFNRS